MNNAEQLKWLLKEVRDQLDRIAQSSNPETMRSIARSALVDLDNIIREAKDNG